ncbi:MAG: arylesterase [Burkholderiales bacterium]|jgi:lysophospholipase L1-like esterase
MRLSKIRHFLVWLCLLACAGLAACSEKIPGLPRLAAGDVVLAFGDSLTYGTGAPYQQSYPAVLSELIGHTVVSSGVPGEQTAEGLERLPEALDTHQPRILLLCLGGNDMLRKVDVAETEANLRQMIDMAQGRGIAVVLIGVPAPALFGATAGFHETIAQDYAIAFEGDALNEILRDNEYKSDPVHPNARGYRMLATSLADLLKRGGAI